jgi:transcription antitermination factor NusG
MTDIKTTTIPGNPPAPDRGTSRYAQYTRPRTEKRVKEKPEINGPEIPTAPDRGTSWYALYTRPRAEKRVKEKLEINGIECYLPLHRTPRVWSDRVKMVDLPLFNSYIFVRCRASEILRMNKVYGVIRIVYYDGKPAKITQAEIDAIRTFINEAAGKVLCKGEEAEILTGSMKHCSGEIIEIRNKYILLHIRQLMATVCVNIENVAPLKRVK